MTTSPFLTLPQNGTRGGRSVRSLEEGHDRQDYRQDATDSRDSLATIRLSVSQGYPHMYAVLGCSILVSVNPRGRANLFFTHSDKCELAEDFFAIGKYGERWRELSIAEGGPVLKGCGAME